MRPFMLTLATGIFALGLSMPVISAPHGAHDGGHHGKSHAMKQKTKKGGHSFTPKWSKTLSDEQKLAVDKMHLEVSKVKNLLRAQIKVAKIELRLLAVQDNTNMHSINKKVDEIAKIKAKIMKNRYAHIVEMRDILTVEQRITYDMGILSHKKKKH